MEEEENGGGFIWKASSSEPNSMVSVTLGRSLHTLLDAKPKKLQDAISRLQSPPKSFPFTASLDQSLWFLHKYVGEAANKEEQLDDALIPMIEHSMKLRESKNNTQAMILLNWLFQDEIIFLALASNLADLISRKDDKYIALGWCTLVRAILNYQTCMTKLITNGIQERYASLLKILSSCITHLLTLVRKGSTLLEGFELPTRLAAAAADCILSFTVSLTQIDSVPDNVVEKEKLLKSNSAFPVSPVSIGSSNVRELSRTRKYSARLDDVGLKMLLWDHIDDHITLVDRLRAWSRKSRPLHLRGLEGVSSWLNATKARHIYFQNEADMQMLKPVILLLSSCWKHYGVLLHLEDDNFHQQQYKELLEQYLSGIQAYTDDHSEEAIVDRDGRTETIKFFLNCLTLLLGKLDSKQFNIAIADFGPQLSKVLISQLKSADEDVIDTAVCIFKAMFFRSKSSPLGETFANSGEVHAVVDMLLDLLEERDGAAKAAIKLVAQYCSLGLDEKCIKEVLKKLSTGNHSQRLNAVDVISDIVLTSGESVSSLSDHMWQDIANNLLKGLGDVEPAIQTSLSKIIPLIDPSLVLPELVHLIYSADEIVQSLASHILTDILKNHTYEPKVVCDLLDSLSTLFHGPDQPRAAIDKKGSKLDASEVLKLLPEWSRMVKDWKLMINALLDKLLDDPSNAVIIRSLTYISEHLADNADLVFHRLLLFAEGSRKNLATQNVDTLDLQHSVFTRLCPLLVIRLLPLRVFDDLNSPSLYGKLNGEHLVSDCRSFTGEGADSICKLLLTRALNNSEYEDVRKLSAELCGRIHPHVLIPIISSQLELAVEAEDTMKIKSCLFSICTSLMIRGKDSCQHPGIISVRKLIEVILSWPSVDRDDVMKAQHGCIDCLAWMLCTELDSSKALKSSNSNKAELLGESVNSENQSLERSVSSYVTDILTQNKFHHFTSSGSSSQSRLSFRLCMANVLISACQKISTSGKKRFARKVLPTVLHSARGIEEADLRAACNQVLFSAVYHLKASVLPYASDILTVALQSLRDGSENEKATGAKLIASLMASEDAILQNVTEGLVEARSLLNSIISSSDSSSEVQQLCRNLLFCFMS